MKILKIRFENIHSLKGKHEVDFGEGILAEAGLFAITGPTGSGKSTLLDVITLALYDRTARMGKLSDSVVGDDGGIMTRNMRSCYAEIEYSVSGKNYRSHWSIERNRNNNLNQRKMEVVEADTGIVLENRIRETPELNTELIGLSYKQFIKSIVLAQGDFSKLLLAQRKERNELLEDITGAKSYRNIGKAVYLKYKGIEKQIELKEANLEGIEMLSDESISEKKAALKELTECLPKIEKAYQTASENINTRQELTRKQVEKKQLDEELLKLNKDKEEFKPFKIELERHEKLSKYALNLRDYDVVLREANQLEEDVENLKLSTEEAEKLQKTYLNAISSLLNENVDAKTANQKLETFRNTITELQAEEKKIHREASLYQEQLSRDLKKINQLGYKLSIGENPSFLKTEIEDFGNRIKTLLKDSGANSLEELNSQVEIARKAHEKAADLLTKKEHLSKVESNLKAQLENLKKAKTQMVEDSSNKSLLEKEVGDLKEELEILEKNLELQRKHQNLEEYRMQLEPEQPCPLCGSMHHPYASEEPFFDAKEEMLKLKKDAFQTKSKFLITLNEKNKFQVKEINEIESNLQNLAVEEKQIQEILNQLAHQLKWNEKESLENLKNHRLKLGKDIEKMEESRHAFQADSILTDLEEGLKKWILVVQAYNKINQKRTALYEGTDINEKANVLSTRLTRTQASLTALEGQLENNGTKLKNLLSEKVKIEANLKAIVLKEQLENLAALRKAILSEERAGRIRKREDELKERSTRISENEKSLKKLIHELSKKDDVSITNETLNTVFEASKKQLYEHSENIGQLKNILKADEKAKLRQKKFIDELILLQKDLALWKTMNDLIGDATGNKFSNFVQDLTLEQLISYANKRLSEFSDRYLLDIPTADEAEKSDTLKVLDNYMGNARRSVRTLSGGETFLVSLAMAFALSDIAAKNVKIESLFIDEGFGTLDPETLDQAITILEKMQNEGDKSVGVISHVSALKERITTQIKLDKGSLGYSTLEVVQ